ncbi:hypothetical protein BGZ81_007261 [Podila clonocystis]|nr:hypothetical protein BGZ81_007261 [Podila clonocystis]
MHPNMMPFMSPMHMQQMMHQQQLFFAQQRQLHLQQQHQQHQDQTHNKQDELSDHLAELRLQDTTPDNKPHHNMDSFRDGESPQLHSSPLNRDSSRRSPHDRHSTGSVPFGMGVHNPMMHPPMFNGVNPNFDPSMVPVQTPNGLVFVPVNRMTPPPGFGHFPMPMSDQGTGSPSPQPGQLPFHSGFHHHPQMHQMFMQHHLQAQNRLGSASPFAQDTQRGGALDQSEQSGQTQGEPQNAPSGVTSGQPEPSQQHQIKDIENQINHLLFRGEPSSDSSPPSLASSGNWALSGHLTLQEIEKAQELLLHNPGRRVSLADPVTPPRSRSIHTTEHLNSTSNTGDPLASTLAAKVSFDAISPRHVDPTTSQPQYDPTAVKAPFSVKDIDFYSDRKYDPYRPSFHTFDLITRDASFLCAELLPNPAEETRKLALLQRLSEISVETFGEAEVLPFGSSGNGLALANADMDVCVFLNAKEGEEEVSPAEFVERIGDRLEKEPDFENVLQLRKARVPIVKLNHINGIACDIGYQNDLAIWNTRLLRAYCKADRRVRDIVVIVKQWAKKRKINNPYTGSLSSYAYVLLVIHVLQRRGVLPNLQATVEGNGQVPFWDCQGFNRYFFEDISRLSRYWQPTPESLKQSVGELLYEFFRYFASEFRYATHVVSIRKGGLLTKEMKEWTKDYTQSQAESKSNVKNRYLFCIEDPFELDHNVGRPVDRYSLFTIRGEFMRAAKILSKNGDGAIGRLCVERHVPAQPEKPRTNSIDQGDDSGRPSNDGGNFDDAAATAFAPGEDTLSQARVQGSESVANPRDPESPGTASTFSSNPRNGRNRRQFHKRVTIAGGESRFASSARV